MLQNVSLKMIQQKVVVVPMFRLRILHFLMVSFSLSILVTSVHAYDAKLLSQLEEEIDQYVGETMTNGLIPGAVVLVGTLEEGTIFHKAYGKRSIRPAVVENSTDTIYDLASVSKVFTATAVGILAGRRLLAFEDKVHWYIPEFNTDAKREITIEQLLRHLSGYRAVNYMRDYDPELFTIDQMWENIFNLELVDAPGVRTVYTDLGFMILSKIVEVASGVSFQNFVEENIFEKLGMTDTSFYPAGDALERTAPTEDDVPLGLTHDPRCRAVGGAAGNAGIFSTTKDIEKLSRFFLSNGKVGEEQVIPEATFREMVTIDESNIRGLGFSIADSYSKYLRGNYLPLRESYGHSGYTGTMFWIDDRSEFYYTILANRVHTGDTSASKRALSSMRRDIANSIGTMFYPKETISE